MHWALLTSKLQILMKYDKSAMASLKPNSNHETVHDFSNQGPLVQS